MHQRNLTNKSCDHQEQEKWSDSAPSVLPSALLFDCDGVLVHTEKEGHRISSATLSQKSLQWFHSCWDPSKQKKLRYLQEMLFLVKSLIHCVLVEDSAIGLAAAKAASMKCIVTNSGLWNTQIQ
ncbi:CBBY-like protein [Cornus florida]|uniref:CBBY-like protein n=1 Tax=Cornus florida TaxID=4283 RepID=UPI0028A29158|nr:CBBY-like protein [Cornus florida]